VDTNTIVENLHGYEKDIQHVMSLFHAVCGKENPCALWRQGKLSRIGVLGEHNYEYSLHGRGCTVDYDGKTISFDFEGMSYVYTPFKFLTYLDDESLSNEEIEAVFMELVSNGILESREGRGVRMRN
jgi:hypothetical protein